MGSKFIIGKDRETVNQAVIALGWRKAGRASWLKPDGTEVHYLHFAEQIASVTAGDTVHIVGAASKMISALKFSAAFIALGKWNRMVGWLVRPVAYAPGSTPSHASKRSPMDSCIRSYSLTKRTGFVGQKWRSARRVFRMDNVLTDMVQRLRAIELLLRTQNELLSKMIAEWNRSDPTFALEQARSSNFQQSRDDARR